MKKITFKLLSFIALSAITIQAKAQWNINTPGTEVTTQSGVNKVGIGTSSPTKELTINGDVDFTSQPYNWQIRSVDGNSLGGLYLYSQQSDANGVSIRLNSNSGNWGDGNIGFIAGGNLGDPGEGFSFRMNHNNTMKPIFLIHKNGNSEFNGKVFFSTQANNWDRRQIDGNTAGGFDIYSQYNDANGSNIRLNSNSSNAGDGNIRFVAGGNIGSSADAFSFHINNNNIEPTIMTIKKDGKVIIGNVPTGTVHAYKLYVQDGIITEKLRVANSNDALNWADFVFDDNYNLSSLADVEKFIQKNKHLPEIPSTAEVQKNGIDVAEMDAKLLQKIEELTLYVIQQQKEIDKLKKKLK